MENPKIFFRYRLTYYIEHNLVIHKNNWLTVIARLRYLHVNNANPSNHGYCFANLHSIEYHVYYNRRNLLFTFAFRSTLHRQLLLCVLLYLTLNSHICHIHFLESQNSLNLLISCFFFEKLWLFKSLNYQIKRKVTLTFVKLNCLLSFGLTNLNYNFLQKLVSRLYIYILTLHQILNSLQYLNCVDCQTTFLFLKIWILLYLSDSLSDFI